MTAQQSVDMDRFSNATALDISWSDLYAVGVVLIALSIFSIIIIGSVKLLILSFKALARFVLYLLGFRPGGVERDSIASRYQSKNYGGHVPDDSHFARFQAYGADSEDEGRSLFAIIVGSGIWLAGAGYVYVLGRDWGWWN
ncbi:hypothetical protein PAXINDRAFT_102210 [Paxillus involutus ATCC 200175]|uniref:Uncharacterized protein n=1 Tax=Paxillus involutus ATCC 200175 TaxID=664439 RepID=A0A0C9TR55_PAXIN|nr:hypothetical protein PAXINDRAFT_102210 [Paxillus involutus ATCC 200175]